MESVMASLKTAKLVAPLPPIDRAEDVYEIDSDDDPIATSAEIDAFEKRLATSDFPTERSVAAAPRAAQQPKPVPQHLLHLLDAAEGGPANER